MSKLDDAAFVAAPISGSGDQAVEATQSVDGVMCLATSSSSQRIKIPEKWRGRYLCFQALTLDVDVLVGTSSVSVTVNQVSTVSSEELTLNAATGGTVSAGTKDQWATERASGQTHFAFRSTGATGFLKVWPSDKRHVGKN